MVIMLSLISISNPTPSQQVDRLVLKADLSYGAATNRFDHKADLLQRPDIAFVSGPGLYDPGFSSFERTKIPEVGATETGLGRSIFSPSSQLRMHISSASVGSLGMNGLICINSAAFLMPSYERPSGCGNTMRRNPLNSN
jgi:hypothetical protein